jgi:hypothetical protein
MNNITVINIYTLWKNSSKHIERTFYQLDNLFGLTPQGFQFNLFALTNDNSDRTEILLRNWMDKTQEEYPQSVFKLKAENYGAPTFGSVTSSCRTALLAFFRNQVKRMGLSHPSRASLVIDTDISFSNNDFLSLYNNLITLPDCAGVLSSTTQDNVADFVEGTAPYSQYDIFPFRDKLGNPGCYFSRTPFYLKEDREKFLAGCPVEVSSAFGSMGIYDSEAYNQCEYSGSFNSEHVALSYQIRQFGKLYVDPNSTPSTTIDLSTVNIETCKKIGGDNLKTMHIVNKLQEWSVGESYQFEFNQK